MEGFTFDTRAEDLRHVWIPLTLKMSISKSQGLEISSSPEGEEVREEEFQLISGFLFVNLTWRLTTNVSDQLSAAEEEEGFSLYDLVVTVPHVLDARTGGNLVAHIKVGETYHQRKEVREAVSSAEFRQSVNSFWNWHLKFVSGSHTSAVVPLQRFLNWADRQGRYLYLIHVNEMSR